MKKKLCIFLSAVLLLMLFAGCSSSAKSEAYDSSANYKTESVVMEETKAEAPAAGDYFGGSVNGAPMEPMSEPEIADDKLAESNSPLKNVKLIYTADIEMETTEFDTAVEKLDALVAEMGGYFESSNLNSRSTYRSANYTIRVPAENFDDFCDQAGQLCQVLRKSRYAEDVSEQYYDIESRLFTQRTKLERLQELLKGAEIMEDIITIESAISDTELNIERLTGDLRKYDSLVGYSTVYLYLNEVYKMSEIEEPVIGFGAKFVSAFKTGCASFVNNLQRFALNFAYNWISWLIFIAIAVAVLIIARKKGLRLPVLSRKRQRKAEDEGEEKK